MHDKMMKMLMGKKKEGKTLSDPEKKAKLEALGGMRDMAHNMMSGKLKDLKKVAVASDSKSGLKEGLHKAEDLLNQEPSEENPSAYAKGGKVGQLPPEFDRDEDHVIEEHERDNGPRNFDEGGMADEESPEHEASESPEMEAKEGEESVDQMVEEAPEDPDQLDELIRKLEEKKQKLAK